MATITKKNDKWYVQIRRSFHKPIYKMFTAKQDAHKWSRETERSIELGQYVDTTEANKTTLRQLLERYEREVSVNKRSDTEPYQIKNLLTFDFVDKHSLKYLNQISPRSETNGYCKYQVLP